MASILLIDDDDDLREYLTRELRTRGHAVDPLDSAEDGLDRVKEVRFEVVVLDNKMPRLTGLQFLAEIRSRGVAVPVLLMTASPDPQIAIKASALGVFNYVIKGTNEQLLARLESEIEAELGRAQESARLPSVRFPPRDSAEPGEHVLVGNSAPMFEVCRRIGLYASGRHPVLIHGETGTGKELVARAIHDFGPRKGERFIAMNCGAFNKNLIESELFGHEKSAYTGADRQRIGRFEQANGGTLFLDEIGDMPLELQVKLLRVLQEGRFERVGGSDPVKVDVRVLAATHRDLMGMVREGKFREDLYYRLTTFITPLPPLRDRLEDLPDLIDCFLSQEAAAEGRPRPEVAEAALEKLREYHWPGNVRDLKNVIARAFTLCQGSQILPTHIEFPSDGAAKPQSLAEGGRATTPEPATEGEAVACLRRAVEWAFDTGQPEIWPLLRDLLERELLAEALKRCEDQTAISTQVGMSWNTVSSRLKKYNLKG